MRSIKTLYKKNEILFSILWIVIYVVGSSIADNMSRMIGIEKSITFLFHAVLSVFLYTWIKRNALFQKYGICKTDIAAWKFLYYIPLFLIGSCNLWFGYRINYFAAETVLYILSMLCVGFLEELIFRGFLFKAMSKDNVRSAIIVSSITFGFGHIINLFNGSGADLLSNICQVIYAVAFGFLFVILFYRGRSLLPCILTHSAINALSAFGVKPETAIGDIGVAAVLTIIAIAYTLILLKTLPKVD